MQRVQKQGGESENAQRTAQAKFTSKSRESELANSPAMIAQRKKLNSLFGDAIQRVEDEEPLQGKFEAVQRVEEEEPLQGKFSTIQRVEEEEPLQGKFETAQRVDEEEPLQGKFNTVQRVEEEESLQGKFETAQMVEEEEPLQGKFATAQMKHDLGEEEFLPGKFGSVQRVDKEGLLQQKVTQREEAPVRPNNTGLPDNLKNGIESLSGMSMDNVKVHYNSSQPAQLNALAYAQGTDIHVAPGQEQHLPHEAWHVVQQAQGRVKPTMQMKEGVPVNDDKGLEHEADVMGGRALSVGLVQGKSIKSAPSDFAESVSVDSTKGWMTQRQSADALQCKVLNDLKGGSLAGTGPLKAVDDTTNYNIYEKTLETVNSKEKALIKAAEENAALGNHVHTNNNRGGILAASTPGAHTFTPGRAFTTGDCTTTRPPLMFENSINLGAFPEDGNDPSRGYFNRRWRPNVNQRPIINSMGNPFNKDNILTIDPFLYRYKIKYSNTDELQLLYQHAKQWTGYVVGISDTGKPGGTEMENTGNNTLTTNGIPDTYSNRHANTGEDKLITKTKLDTEKSEEENEKALDAMTKVAGEGARWQSVRKHASRLADKSKFFVRAGYGIHYVTFQTLWLSWASAFSKAYDISDATLANEIRTNAGNFGGGGVQTGTIYDHAGELDYDVDAGQPYAAALENEWTSDYLKVKDSRDKTQIAAWYKRMTRSENNKALKEYLLGRSHVERMWIDLDSELKEKVIGALNKNDKFAAIATLF